MLRKALSCWPMLFLAFCLLSATAFAQTDACGSMNSNSNVKNLAVGSSDAACARTVAAEKSGSKAARKDKQSKVHSNNDFAVNGFTVLYNFTGGNDGANPYASLIQDSSNNLYTTTTSGGANFNGAVFELSPSGTGTGLYGFVGRSTGFDPTGSLVRDASGNLYGTASTGGTGCSFPKSCGVVFKVDTLGNETVLHKFTDSPDGKTPYGGLVEDPATGYFIGTTYAGGAGVGTVYAMDSSGTLHWRIEFMGGTDGANPEYGTLVLDSSEFLYGTTLNGGNTSCNGGVGCGTVFKVDASTWPYAKTVLHSFGGSGDGRGPSAGVAMDSAGNLYGTTTTGGTYNAGTVWKLSPNGSGYTETVLYSFPGAPDGATPNAGVVLDSYGNLYGVTFYGGDNSAGGLGNGVLYELSPEPRGGCPSGTTPGNGYCETLLHTFATITNPDGSTSYPDGYAPYGGVIVSPDGNLYGTAAYGGSHGQGTVWGYPVPPPSYTLTVTVAGTGTGTITDSTGAISCPGTCSASFSGTVTLTETPGGTSTFNGTGDGWSGACSGNATTCSVTMSANESVTATFTAQTTPTCTWPTPLPISYGALLTSTQLDATCSVPGTYLYSPAAGQALGAGNQTLSLTFTPTDNNDYTVATASVILQVNQATPVITWATPSPITYGTPLSSAQLDATCSVPSTLVYSPAAGVVLGAGNQTLSVTCIPTDTADYTTPAPVSVPLTVAQATPIITWPAPAPITYGTNLSGVLNATDSLPGSSYVIRSKGKANLRVKPKVRANSRVKSNDDGTFVYTLADGTPLTATTVLSASSTPYTLVVNFTPNDTTDYATPAPVSVSLTVNQASQTITFTTPAPASAAANSSFTVAASASSGLPVTYTSSGSCSNSGATYTMINGAGTCSVIANQAGNSNYLAATPVTETVSEAAVGTTISCTTPAAITYGTPLSAPSCTTTPTGVTGTFTYAPALGTILNVPGQSVAITFNPTNNATYAQSATSVMQQVNQASQSITFTTNAPASAIYGTSFTVAASASSGLAVTYSSSGSCSNSGATYTMTSGTGTCSVIANQAGNSNYLAAPPVPETVTAALASQTIVVTQTPPATAINTSSFVVAATASTPVVITGSGACTPTTPQASPATFTMNSASTKAFCTVMITAPQSANYSAATPVVEPPTYVAKAIKPTATLTASASSATYQTQVTVTPSLTPASDTSVPTITVPAGNTVCTISGTTVTMISGTGVCTVTATWPETNVYSSASAKVNIKAVKAIPTIIWSPAAITYGTPLSATQQDASANVDGAFVYSPRAGTVLSASTTPYSLSAKFTPTDTVDYADMKTTVDLTVNQATTTTSITGVTASNPKRPLVATVDFTVAGQDGGKLTGNITVTATTGEFCTATPAKGSCTITFDIRSAGIAETLTAVYPGDQNNITSSGNFPYTVPTGAN